MNKPQKVRAIYLELKAALGCSYPDSELLEAAAKTVETLSRVTYSGPKASIAEHDRSFRSLGVDTALADGGWRILSHEKELMNNYYMQADPDFSEPGFVFENY